MYAYWTTYVITVQASVSMFTGASEVRIEQSTFNVAGRDQNVYHGQVVNQYYGMIHVILYHMLMELIPS